MSRTIFVSLPVADLAASKRFYEEAVWMKPAASPSTDQTGSEKAA
jgi:predicted lactoylglutathione lyase